PHTALYTLSLHDALPISLRERTDDIPILAAHFAHKAATKHGRATPSFTPSMLNTLMAYRWPGNIRELENLIERAVVISTAPVLEDRKSTRLNSSHLVISY